MKKIILCLFATATLLTSCLKEKSYTCQCTYVANIPPLPIGTPNKVEVVTVKSILRESASSDCAIDNEGKYVTQSYKGTCILLD